jgi:hypothetical protein
MHLPPDAVREMDFEDVIGIAVHSQMEAEQFDKDHPSTKPGQKVTKLKKR